MKPSFLACLLVFIVILPLSAQEIDRTNLVGEWTFDDGTADDSSGNENHGTGTAANVEGVSGRAFEFDGTQSISVNEFSENFVFDQNFTLEAWVYVIEGSQTMIRKGGGANFLLELGVGRTNDPGSNPQFGFATDQVNIGASIVNGPDEIPLGRWTFLTMTYDGAHLRGYVNGEMVAENAVTGSAINNTAQPLLFGNYNTEVFIGRLDEIRIWSRTLSEEEIIAHFEALAPSLRTNLVGEWLFEGNEEDTSGHGNHGVPVGDALLVDNGISGQAYEMFGAGAVEVQTFSDTFVFEDEFTLTAWVRPTAGSQTMIRKGGAANFLLELGVGRTNDPGSNAQFGFATDQVNIGASIVTGPVLPLDQWSFVTMSYDGAQLRGYVNGVLVASNPVTGMALNDPSQILMFGRYSAEAFFGILDEIRIWNRTLREREIQDLFAEHANQPDVFQFQRADRTFDDLTYTPERQIPVYIDIVGQPGDLSLTETPPEGWSVSGISHGGQLADGVIRWDVTGFTGEQRLSYQVTPPAGTAGEAAFTGTIGENAIGGFMALAPGSPIGLFENHLDIGDVAIPGSIEYDEATGMYTIVASGKEIWNHADELHFAYNRTSGDFRITATVVANDIDTGGDAWASAGLIVREDLAPNSAYGFIFIRSDLNLSFSWRPIKGVYPDRTAPFAGVTQDVDLLGLGFQDGRIGIERIGNTINLFYIDFFDDEPYTLSTWDVDWQDPLYVGIAAHASMVSSGDGMGTVEGIFEDVNFEGTVKVMDWSIY